MIPQHEGLKQVEVKYKCPVKKNWHTGSLCWTMYALLHYN